MPTIAEQWIREGEQRGEQRGRNEGRNEGRKEAKLELARRLLERGMSPAEVAVIVDLPKEQVLALAQ